MLEGEAGIPVVSNCAADDDEVGSGRERFSRCGNTLLVVQGLIRQANSRRDDLEFWLYDFPNQFGLPGGTDHAIDTAFLGEKSKPLHLLIHRLFPAHLK